MSTAEFVSHALLWGVVVIPLLVMSIVFLKGYGADWIAGFNTMDKGEQKKYDQRTLCRFMGKFLLVLTLAMMILFPVGIYAEIMWLPLCVLTIIMIGGIVYANTGNRFHVQGEVVVVEETASEKIAREKRERYAVIAVGIVITLFPLIVIPIAILLALFAPR